MGLGTLHDLHVTFIPIGLSSTIYCLSHEGRAWIIILILQVKITRLRDNNFGQRC